MTTMTRQCKTCREVKPISQFERRTSGWRHVCNTCRNAERAELRRILSGGRRLEPRQPMEDRRAATTIANAFALWFGPVDRSRPLIWSVGSSTPTNNNEESHP